MGSPSGHGANDGADSDDDAVDGEPTRAGVVASSASHAVAVALDEYTDEFATALESALAGRSGLVATGVPLGLLPPILAARRRTDDAAPWRIACREGVVDALGRALALGTDVAEATADGSLELRTITDERRSLLFATPDRADAVAGPCSDPRLVSDTDDSTAGAVFRATTSRFEAATPATVDMPPRTALLDAAREMLDDRFATDLAAVLDGLEYGALGRTGTVTDRTLLVALAARHDHLFWDLRRWVDGDGDTHAGRAAIAPGQDLTADRRALVERELIESIKVPMGPGRPKLRLRAIDETLLRAKPDEVLSVLRERFARSLDADGAFKENPDGQGRRPVWDR
jgi:hypothetical protein